MKLFGKDKSGDGNEDCISKKDALKGLVGAYKSFFGFANKTFDDSVKLAEESAQRHQDLMDKACQKGSDSIPLEKTSPGTAKDEYGRHYRKGPDSKWRRD
ncbi:MAG: hypothetical protein FWC00_03810 [Firmicutes bacterium]|nr:hypothetical protein [Bacillota bacterium]